MLKYNRKISVLLASIVSLFGGISFGFGFVTAMFNFNSVAMFASLKFVFIGTGLIFLGQCLFCLVSIEKKLK